MTKLFTVTGPSGSGKTTLVRALLKTGYFTEIVSFTSRQPRAGEVHGTDYYFMEPKICEKLVAAGECAEHIKFKENHYGITKAEIDLKIGSGKTPIVIVEPKGLEQLTNLYDCFPIYVDCDLVTLYTRFLSRFHLNMSLKPDTDISYEAKRIAAIYMEQREWPSKFDVVTGQNREKIFMTYYVGEEKEHVERLVELSKTYNNTQV